MMTQWLPWSDFIAQVTATNRGKLIDLAEQPLPLLSCVSWTLQSNPEFKKLVVELKDGETGAQAWYDKFSCLGHENSAAFAERKHIRAYLPRPICTNYRNKVLTFWFISGTDYPKETQG